MTAVHARQLSFVSLYKNPNQALTTEELLNGLSPDLTLRFLATFARMEFALKQLRFLRFAAEGDRADGPSIPTSTVELRAWSQRR
jgi:hypothetical protein